MALADQPASTIADVVHDVICGAFPALDQRFAPNPPQLAGLVRERARPEREALADLRALSTANEYRPGDLDPKQFVVDGFDSLRAELVARQDERRGGVNARFVAHLVDVTEKMRIRDCQREGIDPDLGVTPSLLRLLKQLPPMKV